MAKIIGVRQVKAAIRRAGPAVEEEALKEVRRSTVETFKGARQRLDGYVMADGTRGMKNRTGRFRRFFRFGVSKRNLSGRVGFLSARAARAAFYAKFFVYGTSNQVARPFLSDEFDVQKDVFIVRQGKALDRVLRKVFN